MNKQTQVSNPQITNVSNDHQNPSQDDQDLLGNAAIEDTLLGKEGAPKNLTPGIIFSNTSETNLKDTAEARDLWASQGYAHSNRYEVEFDLSTLSQMGADRTLDLEGGTPIGSRFKNQITGPNGEVGNSGGTTRFVLRGGHDLDESTVKLTVANNGCLNLWRLSLAAKQVVDGFGLAHQGEELDYGGGNYEVQCSMTMGNEKEDEHARDHGFVAGIDSETERRIAATIRMVCAAAILHGKYSSGTSIMQTVDKIENARAVTNQTGPFHTQDALAPVFQVGGNTKHKVGEQFVWAKGDEIDELGSGRFQKIWMESKAEKNTWFSNVPDCSSILSGLNVVFTSGQYGYEANDDGIKQIHKAVMACADVLISDDANFSLEFLDLDPGVKAQYIQHYKKLILAAFKEDLDDHIEEYIDERRHGNSSHIERPQPLDPSEGDTQHLEGQ